ncbi:MAG: TolC family protein [Thermoanaerobaculia bacterium]
MTLKILRQTPARLGALALLFALAVPAAAQNEDVHSLTLEEAITRALEKNEAIIIERRAADAAAAAETGARGAYDPVLGLDAGWRETSEPVNSAFSGAPAGELAPTDEVTDGGATLNQLLPTGGEVLVRARGSRADSDGSFNFLAPAYSSRLGVELRQPLLRDRAIDPARFNIRAAAADREQAQASLAREVRDTVAEVERAYWAMVAARRDVDVQREAVELAEEQLDETSIRIEGGDAPETEIAQPRAELERRRGDLLEAQESVARAENALKLLVLGDDDGDLWADSLVPADAIDVEVTPVDLATALEQALATRAELAAAEAFVERRRIEAAFAGDRIRPALDLVVSYDRFGLAGDLNPAAGTIPGLPGEVPAELEGDFGDAWSGIADGDFDDTRIGLLFEVPIGNRSARANAEIAENTRAQAEAELSRLRKSVRAEVLDAAATLSTAGGRIEAARAAREAAEVQLEAEQERFAVGLSTNFLVLTRQNDLASARLNETRALTDYRTARIEMARATGALLRERGIEVSPNA